MGFYHDGRFPVRGNTCKANYEYVMIHDSSTLSLLHELLILHDIKLFHDNMGRYFV